MKKKLNFLIITGLTDAEGSFIVNIVKDKKEYKTSQTGFKVLSYFELALNAKDKFLLEYLKLTLGVGNITYNKSDNTFKFKVGNINELYKVIIPFFTKYRLVTQKRADFELFTKIVEIIIFKHHLTVEGLQRIINLKVHLNRGLSADLKKIFPNTVPIPRPKVVFSGIPDPYWLVGFAEGESCFFVRIYRSEKSRLGTAVQLSFIITQHSRDKDLLYGILEYFASIGRVKNRSSSYCDFIVNSVKDLDEKIIPFFIKHPLPGSKSLNYLYFKKVLEMIKKKEHLTENGLLTIRNIKAGMNTGIK